MTQRRVFVWGEGALAGAVARRFGEAGARVARSDPARPSAASVEQAAHELGGLDVAVASAPWPAASATIDQLGAADWARQLDAGFTQQALVCRAALEVMREQRFGRIVTIADRDYLGAPGKAATAAAAAAVVSLTRTLALEAGPYGITANAVVPGTIDVGQLDGLPEEQRERLRRLHPGGRFGTPEDVANAVLFFAADESDYITGQTLFVCGGTSVYSSLSV